MKISEILTEAWSKSGVRVNNCVPNESLDADQKRVGQVGGKERAKKIGTVLGTSPKQHPFKGRLVGEGFAVIPVIRNT